MKGACQSGWKYFDSCDESFVGIYNNDFMKHQAILRLIVQKHF